MRSGISILLLACLSLWNSAKCGAQKTDAKTPNIPALVPSGEQHQKAEEQLREEERQRVLGIVPAFNTSYRSDAVSLTGGQKMRLSLRQVSDPVTFAGAFAVAGYREMNKDNTGFGWGPEGYGKRAGAAYLDSLNGTMLGNGIFPALLHQDPRFFRLGHGSFQRRVLYALAVTLICKHDNTGRWEPNYSNVGGNLAAGAISNLYYPTSDAGEGQTISNGLTVTVQGGLGNIFQEFWPDISRKFFRKDPTRGVEESSQENAPERNRPGSAAARSH